MIIWKTGDIFESECNTLVNTVNCVGVMGKGLALTFKMLCDTMYQQYKNACKGDLLKHGGDLWFYRNQLQDSFIFPNYKDLRFSKHVLCFATKEHWINSSQIEWIERGLITFSDDNYWRTHPIKSIAFPKLGCNNGGLNWEDVKSLMIKYLEPIDLYVEIYE